jgi:hypothetical protein
MLESQGYFGWTFWLPPGLPGGGITGVLPASGVGARISGSTPEGGHSTPLDLASLSESGSPACPVVVPGSVLSRGWIEFAVGPQLSATAVAVGAGGVVTVGGAWAAAPDTESAKPELKIASLRRSGRFIRKKRAPRTLVPSVRDHDSSALR